jgi:hypothetical protein
MGFLNRITTTTTTTTRRVHQEEKREKEEVDSKMMAPKVISVVVLLPLNEVLGYLSYRQRKLMGLCLPQPFHVNVAGTEWK